MEYAVPPLPLPDMSLGVERLRENPSVALFVERAQAVRAGFDLTPENAATVVAICQRLDGLPLGIELAAARVRSLPVNQVLERLAQPLRILSGGARDLPARQQTIRTTIQWSYDLLSPNEQRLFRRLAVFVGGWTLETAETVVNIDGDLGIDVLDGLLSLVEKSLVVQHERADGTLRYRLLVPIREFAGEQSDQHGETAALRQRHARAIRDLVQWDFAYLQGMDYDWLDRVGAEHDNVRAALTWASERDDVDLGIEIAGRLGWYWYIKGYLRDGAEWTSAFLARYPMRDERRGRALIGLAIVRTGLGDYDAAERAAADAVAIGREVNAVALVSEGLLLQAVAMRNGHHREDADIEAAFAEAFRLAEANAFYYGMANTLQAWAYYDAQVGRHDRAEELFQRSIAVGGTIGTQSFAWCGLARIAALRGDDDAAIGHCREALLVNRRALHRPSIVETLEILATVLLRNGQAGIAARLLAVTDRERREKGFKLGIGTFPDKVSAEVVRQHLDPAAFAEAWRAGAAMSLEDGVAVALEATED
jgi:tetratricopeptide (TPR) repeat protein